MRTGMSTLRAVATATGTMDLVGSKRAPRFVGAATSPSAGGAGAEPRHHHQASTPALMRTTATTHHNQRRRPVVVSIESDWRAVSGLGVARIALYSFRARSRRNGAFRS